MRTIDSVDGTSIAFERTGCGPPLLLVHGGTTDHTRWEPIRPALEEHFTVYAMDRRGRGGSGDGEDYDLEREFDDVATVVESVDDPVVLLGHSFGAICALEAALRTGNVDTLILYEPPLPVDHHFLDHRATLAEMKRRHANGEDERALVLFFREIAMVQPWELDALRRAPDWPARVDAVNTVIREVGAVIRYEFDPDRFAAVTVPTLLVSGSESPRFLHPATDALAEALPDTRLVVFDGHGHAAMNSASDRFVETVLAFVHDASARVDP